MDKGQRMSRKIEITMSDLIDLYLVALQATTGGEVAPFLLEFFPDNVNENDFKAYWQELDVYFEPCRKDIEAYAEFLKSTLKDENKWDMR